MASLINGHEFEQALGVGYGQGSLACHSPWGCRVRQDWRTELNWSLIHSLLAIHCVLFLPLKSLSRVRLFATPWTIQSMEFSSPEYWSGSPYPSPGDLPNPVIEPRSPVLQTDSLQAEPQGKPKNTGVYSLSLLQQIFPTQESNWGCMYWRHILYQLS